MGAGGGGKVENKAQGEMLALCQMPYVRTPVLSPLSSPRMQDQLYYTGEGDRDLHSAFAGPGEALFQSEASSLLRGLLMS